MVSTLRSIPNTQPQLDLCLFDSIESSQEEVRIRMTEHSDEVWHIFLPDIKPGQLYGYRVEEIRRTAKGLIRRNFFSTHTPKQLPAQSTGRTRCSVTE